MSVNKLSQLLKKIPTDLSRAKAAVEFAINPNHRHDEQHEKANDEARAAIRNSHRFNSFAGERDGNDIKWYIDGHDYFYALSTLLDGAKESICILDWWLSPELYLRRPPALHEEFRVDRLLLRKAQQGVKIMIIVYKEVVATMAMNSKHTKHALEDLHENIAVMRNPDHSGGEVTLLWSHHEKLVIVDGMTACVGGLDICLGRWDTHTAPISDVHPTDFSRTLFPGQDYNNARIKDFTNVNKWIGSTVSKLDAPRMAWHDISVMLTGPIVMDCAAHFTERWNFVMNLKYKHDDRYLLLAFPFIEPPTAAMIAHPHWEEWKDKGKHFFHHTKIAEEREAKAMEATGKMKIQMMRSSCDWSLGILTEHSIQNAYLQSIAEASHFIYIENQFFITNTGPNGPVKNQIGSAIVARVLSAARDGKKFKVVIVLPAIPGFAGDLKGNSGTLAIMGTTYNSISRGEDSIFGMIKKAGYDPNEYISVYALRSYDRINYDPERLDAMAAASGVTFDQAQAALGRVFLGAHATIDDLKENQHMEFFMAQGEGDSLKVDKGGESRVIREEMPADIGVAWDRIHKFEAGGKLDESISDSVAHHSFQNTGSLFDEKWSGSEASERSAYVQEEHYVHTKIMIVDDRRVIIGSANINDRSQLGSHDSEIAICIEDGEGTEGFKSIMDGKPYMASSFVSSLRRQLWKQHLGLTEVQECPHDPNHPEPVTSYMKMVGTENLDISSSPEDLLVMDPLSDETIALWKGTALTNTDSFEAVFHTVPTNQVKTWKEYHEYMPKAPIKAGHVFNNEMPLQHLKTELDKIKGHLVDFPHDFLVQEDLILFNAEVNALTIEVYI